MRPQEDRSCSLLVQTEPNRGIVGVGGGRRHLPPLDVGRVGLLANPHSAIVAQQNQLVVGDQDPYRLSFHDFLNSGTPAWLLLETAQRNHRVTYRRSGT